MDADHIESLLQASARAGEAMTYGQVLNAIGMSFSRPKMRALCKLLDDIDSQARGRGEPELAVLVVRASDGLPGQGWWIGGRPRRDGYAGPWEGPQAKRLVQKLHAQAFDYWGRRS